MAIQEKSWPENWYTTFCWGPLGVPKNAFGQIRELNFQEIFTLEEAISPEASIGLNSQIGPKAFLGTPKGPQQNLVYQFSGHDFSWMAI